MADFRSQGLTYDDVLLVPKHSGVASRRHVSTSSPLSRHINLSIPIVSANMDTVTEAPMAVAMARQGGIGIIHRFMSVAQHVREVQQVKRAQGSVVEQPYTMLPDQTLAEARRLMAEREVSGVLVVDERDRLVGILTARDIRFATDPAQPIAALMTPRERLVTAPLDVDAARAQALLDRHKIEKLPLVDDEGTVRGLITSKDVLRTNRFGETARDGKGRLLVGAAIGVVGDYLERAQALWQAGADVLVIDIAHGHSDQVLAALAAGASTVMLGSMLAGTRESPGYTVVRNGQRYKICRGMASLSATIGRREREQPELAATDESFNEVVPEGVEAVVPYRGDVADIVYQLVGGLRSGLSYCGARTIPELHERATFAPITGAGMRESQSHDVQMLS